MKKKIYRSTIFGLLIINIIGNCVAYFSILGALGMIITVLAVISLPLWNEDIIFKTAEELETERDAHIASKKLYDKAIKLVLKNGKILKSKGKCIDKGA